MILSAWGLGQLQALLENTDPGTRSILLGVLTDWELGERYLQQMTTSAPIYRQQIEQNTKATSMVSGQLVTHLLQLLIKISNAQKILELGTLSGYSALAMAEVLPPSGQIITCDRDGAAQANFDAVPWGQKIQLRRGLIDDTLLDIVQERQQFDLVFLDADKRNYCNYFKTILDHNLLKPGGILCADNTIFRGRVWQNDPNSTSQAIHQFNQLVAQDDRVEQILLPLRDGVTIAYRLCGQ